jgi:recombination protein RecR
MPPCSVVASEEGGVEARAAPELLMSAEPIQRLILELARLPGIGERSAARLAFFFIRASQGAARTRSSLAHDLARALIDVAERVGLCQACGNLCTSARCSICDNPRRDMSLLCVVEGVEDLRALEACGGYRGLYHVLHGAISPLDGVGPADLKLDDLLRRAQEGAFSEVILATNADVEGDATALYVARLLKPMGLRITRLASGIPLGGELEYLDQATLGRALAQRREF